MLITTTCNYSLGIPAATIVPDLCYSHRKKGIGQSVVYVTYSMNAITQRLSSRTFHNISIALSLALMSIPCLGKKVQPIDVPPAIGNFSLSNSQQPGPFIAFGQAIIDANETQVFFESINVKLPRAHFYDANVNVIYGVSDTLAFSLSIPYAVNYQVNKVQSSGLSDLDFQLEYELFGNSNHQYTESATVVGGASFPTGSFNKTPPTGFGTNSFFIGATYNRTYVNWYGFISPGITFFRPTTNNQLGSIIIYQMGVGRNIVSRSNEYTLFGLLELEGQHINKDKIDDKFDIDSGGNLLLLTPSLTFSTQHLIAQIGISLPLMQNLNGNQIHLKYNSLAKIGWTFN